MNWDDDKLNWKNFRKQSIGFQIWFTTIFILLIISAVSYYYFKNYLMAIIAGLIPVFVIVYINSLPEKKDI
jgi:hypothetical protein